MLKVFRRKKKELQDSGTSSETQPTASHKQQSLPTSLPALDLSLPSPSFSPASSDQQAADRLQDTPSKASLWVDVSTPPVSSASQSDVNATKSSNEPVNAQLKRSATSHRRLKARLNAADVALLLEPCVAQIKAKGLEELGIFRPYRWAEDANHQRRLIDLFLKSVHTELAPSNTFDHLTDDEGQALFDVGHKPADLFRDELQYANAHDVAGLIKWGVRHLVAGLAEPKSYQLGQPLSWFGTFETPDKESYARVKNAMNETEGKLLDTIMDLIASVAAYAEVNAMSSSRLCKVLGFWLLAPRRSIPTYQQFYNTWKQSTDTMDRLFLAYLAAQPSLPRRLREILESTNSSHGISVHPALHAVISQPAASSVNGHNNVGSGTDRRRTKSCAALFNKALHSNKTEDTEESEALTEEWWHLLVNEGNSYAQVLNEESARLIALVDPTPETDVKPAVTNSPTSPESPTRRRSMTVDTTSRAFGTPKTLDVAQDPVKRADNLTTHFPNHSSRELQTGTTKFEDDAKAVSWNDFASADFKFGQPGSINLNLAPKLDTAAANDKPHAHATLKKNGSLASRKSRKQQVVTDPQPPTQPPVDAPSPPAPSQLRTVKLTDVEDVFADVFLDAVAERDILAKWPTFAIAQLRKPLGGHRSENAQVRWLVVEEIEPIEATEPQEVIEREASPTRSAKSIAESKSNRRGFMNRISAVFSPADAKKTGVPNVPQSPQKSRKKTSAPPVTVTNQSLERQESRGPINLDSPVQNLPSPSLDVGVAALKASHGSAKSSVSSIKRVKPPSADLVPTSSHVSGEAASTTAMRAPSPNVSRQASTEEMTETLKDDTPSPQIPSTIEATTSQDNSVVESPIAAPREVSQPTVSNPSENEPIVSAEVVEKNKQEPVEKAEAGAETEHSVSKEEQHIHEQTQTSADLEPQTKEDVTGPIAEAVQPVHEEAEGPSVPTAPQPEPELEVSRDSIVDTSAISETVGDEERPSSHAEAKADLSTALPEEDSPDDAQSKPEVSTVTTPAVNSQTATDPQVSTGESEHSGKQEASEQNLETPLAAESASEERAEPAVPPIAVPSASVEPEADNSDKTPTTPQHLEVPESSKPRKSPSAASFASQSSKASSNTSSTPEKKSKKLMAGAKRMMSSPFRKGKKTSQDFSTASSTGSIPDAQASIPDQPEGLSDTKGQIEGDSSANGMERVQEPVQEEPFAAVTLKPAEDETQTSNVAESAEGRKTPTQASPEPSIEPGEPAKIQETGSKSNDQAADPVSTVVEPDSMSAEEGPSHSVESAALKTNQNDESLPSDEPPLSASSEQTSVPILAASSQPADVADESTEPSTKVTAEPFSESMPDSVSQVSLSGGTTSQQAVQGSDAPLPSLEKSEVEQHQKASPVETSVDTIPPHAPSAGSATPQETSDASEPIAESRSETMYKEEEPVHTSAATQASEDIKSSSSTLPASTPVVETPTAEEVGPSAFATPMETPGDLSQVGEKDGGLAASGDDSQEQKMAPSSTTTPEQKEGQSAEAPSSFQSAVPSRSNDSAI